MRGTHAPVSITPTRAARAVGDLDADPPCRRADPDLWFAERPAQQAMAKARCGPCPLRAACLAGALARREPWGVWGGEIVLDGVVLAYKRGRGRPSNSDRRLGLVSRVAATGEPVLTRRDRAGTCRSRSA